MIKLNDLIQITEASCINKSNIDQEKIEIPSVAQMPDKARAEDLALVFAKKHSKAITMLEACKAQVIILAKSVMEQEKLLQHIEEHPNKIYLFVERPKYVLRQIMHLFTEEKQYPAEADTFKQSDGAYIHPSAVVDPSAQLAESVVIGPFVCIGAKASIGANTKLHSRISIGANAKIGSDCQIAAGVTIEDGVQIGNRVVIAANSVIGSDGYSFVTKEPSNLEKLQAGNFNFSMDRQIQEKIVSAGTVIIEDDVDIGSNTSIDKGSIGNTVIGTGTKIDNLCQIAHNVRIGKDCLIVSNVGIAGSTQIGDRVTIAGGAGLADNIKIGHDVVIGAMSGVHADVDPFLPILGAMPAVAHGEFMNRYKAIMRLPDHQREFRELKKKVEAFIDGKQDK